MNFELKNWSEQQQVIVEQALSLWVREQTPANLGEVMRYGVLDGGKRLRPLLVLAAAQAVEGNTEAALRAACSVELIHAYSLIHDDMPCMDNDVLRRNKPTVHVQYGEASALLAGDAMQALAFEILATPSEKINPAMGAQLCYLLAKAAGQDGMAGGQAIDLASVGKALNRQELQRMHELKTGALLKASVVMGAMCGQVGPEVLKQLNIFGEKLGLAFQVVDDILDVTADSSVLGKTAGKDAMQNKPTYVSILGMDKATELAQTLYQEALIALQNTQLVNQQALAGLAAMVVNRVN
jgi:farnesyl diphosphate synthase